MNHNSFLPHLVVRNISCKYKEQGILVLVLAKYNINNKCLTVKNKMPYLSERIVRFTASNQVLISLKSIFTIDQINRNFIL